jgi:hypothetical protein
LKANFPASEMIPRQSGSRIMCAGTEGDDLNVIVRIGLLSDGFSPLPVGFVAAALDSQTANQFTLSIWILGKSSQ